MAGVACLGFACAVAEPRPWPALRFGGAAVISAAACWRRGSDQAAALPLVFATAARDGPTCAAGDRLISVDDRPVAGLLPGGAMTLAWNTRPGARLVLGVDRAGVAETIEVVPATPNN